MAETATREALLEQVRDLAERALGAWPLERPVLQLLEHKKNATFKVEAANGAGPRRSVLRVCDPDGFSEAEILSELHYLLALGPATGLVVPEPVRARDGALLVRAEATGLDRPRWCALFRWVPGRMVADAPTPQRIEQVGEIAGRLHRFSEEWEPPPGFARPRWDAAGLYGRGPVLAPGQGAPLVGASARQLLDEAAGVVREVMAGLGEGREVFGLIHKDLEPDNTVIDRTDGGERVHPIDFADCGWGYYLYDIAAALLPLYEKPGFAAMREAFLRGYRRIRPLRAEHAELLETFFIARGIFSARLMTGRLADLPHVRAYAETALPQILGGIRVFLERRRARTGSATAEIPRTTVQILELLRRRGAKLWPEGEKLRYSAPPGALTPDLLAELKERKTELLGFLRQGQAARRSGAPARIESAHRERPPLSFAQQRLWLLHQLFPEGVEYNIGRAVRLRGRIRVELLQASLQETVRRHGALRTTFAVVDGQPVQVVAPAMELPLPLVDLTGLPATRREPEAWRLAQEDAARPFDLASGPLLRVFLLRLDAADHIAPSTMHHVIGDGWSTGILFREMGLAYAALVRGVPPSLPALPVQYVDFAVWQRQWLTGEVLAEQLAYWKEQLAGAPHELDLPTDRPRSAVHSSRGDRRPLLIPQPLTEALRDFSQAQGATLFMILLAAWQTQLCRLSGQDDIVVGSPIANRNRTEIEGLIGCFVNTLVLRTAFPGNPTFREVLAAVRRTTLGAYAHQDLPFERIVEELRPERSLTQTPLFQVILTLQNVPSPDMEAAGFRMTLMPPTRRAAMVDLTCNMKEMPEGVTTSFMYKEDLFDGATVERLAAQYLRLLEAVAADPDVGIRDLPLLSPAEEHQLLEWGGIREEHAADATLDELFEAQARRAPEAPAVTYEGMDLTYAELSRRASQLADHLRRLGVKPEVRVGLCAERSPELIVGMLGIVKAGGAYVPLDPAYPRERLAYLIEDAGARVVVGTEGGLARLESLNVQTFALGEGFPPLPGGSECGWERGPGGEGHSAYVIYTSGSTGHPKGVLVTHANVVRLLRATEEWFHFSPDDVWTLFHSSAFDFSVWEIWGALLTGGRLVIVPWEVSRTPEAFHALLAAERVTVLNQTPTAFAELMRVDEDPARAPLADLRLVIFGGEALLPSRLAPWITRHGDARPRLVNMYGITETTVHVTYRPLSAADTRSVIGIPIPDLAVHVLDRGGRLAPAGVPGELHVGGAGLARGYLGRPDLTAERFVPDPFAGPGARLYRSGDLGRFLPTGELESLGRIDHQVKIRGFRIEPGEIEAALRAHPEVREAVVLARADERGGRLAAFVVPHEGAQLEMSELRNLLRGTLPEHQVPSSFVRLDALPRTANGKVDRKALLALDETPAPEGGFVAPRTPAEELMAGIFAEVLQAGRLGAEAHFFELGGHSLLATQVVSRVRQALGVELPLRALFEEPTVAGLARRIEAGRDAALPPAIVPVPRQGDLPLSFAQRRLWLLHQLDPDSPVYNLFSAVRLLGPARRSLLQARLAAVVRRHETLRTTFAQPEGEPVQVVHAWLPPEIVDLDLTALSPESRERELRRLAQGELLRPFDLARGPLVRAHFVDLGPEESAALLTMHHIVGDEWSMRLLVEEICGDPTDRREQLPVQYADYAVWQRAWLQGDRLAAELAFWREHLAGAPELLALPTDRPRPAVQTFRGTSSGQALPAELADALRAASRERSATLFMLYLAAFQALLGRITGESEIVVGAPTAGRNRLETEGLIGFFVNTLALRASLAGRPSLAALLERTRETVLAAHTHQDLPFELLVEDLNPRRSLSHTPLFQVMINLATAAHRLELPGLAAVPLDGLRSGIAPFDLTLSASDTGGWTRLVFEYSTDLFDATTIERLHGYLREVLHVLATAPETGLHDVALWSPAERHQVLTEWNDTAAEAVFGPRGLHGLFETWARERPDAPAVFFDGGSWSYAELDARAEALARRLRRRGVGAETVVGLLPAGGPELALGMLGVLKAGGAFLPLDPAWPAARREALLEDAGALLVLDREAMWSEPGPPLSRELVSPEQTAYVIYTSGSTGQPKGVVVGHGAAVSFSREVAARCCLGAGDRFLQFASPGFDVLIEEVFPVWARGGSVVFAPREELLTTAGLERALESHAVTSLELPTPYWNEWADDLERRGAVPPPSLRLLLLGSEKPSPVRLARWERHGIPVIHVFGLTETAVTSTLHPWTGDEPLDRELPIGRPVGNTRLYVLDREGAPVPCGVIGELLIGGLGVARGYLGRPDLTAERFVPDPFADPTDRTDRSDRSDDRLYRTGDLARYRTDGELDFLGRLDEQVKVRGFRVEPGEVAAVLERHPSVTEAFVAVREGRLIAWVIPNPGTPASPEELRSHAAARLPEPMVPSQIVELPALPRTAHGKIDRAALPVPAWESGGGEAPRTPAEELLAGIWSEVLGRPTVGRDEDFFALGGHSLLATQVMSRLRGALGVELPLRALFEAPTVAGLARAVEASRGTVPPPAIVPVPRDRSQKTPLPLSFAQQRLWLLDQLEPESPVYNLFSAVRLLGPARRDLLQARLEAVVRRHEALRTTFAQTDGEPVQVIHAWLPPDIAAIDLTALAPSPRERELRRLAAAEPLRPFDLGRGPLVRARFVALGPEESAVLLTMHHVVSDEWSMSVLVRELCGDPAALPELPVQYADYAVWQRAWLQGDPLEAELAYWRGHLAGAPEMLALPTDRPRPAVQSFRGALSVQTLPAELADALRAAGRARSATPFMLHLAAFQALLGRWTGESEIVLGTPIAGRNHLETEGLIGFFVNTLALRASLAGRPSLATLLAQTRETVLAAHAHQELPFELLVEALNPRRSLSHTPVFQVMINLGTLESRLELPGLALAPLDGLRTGLAPFDLTLSVDETGGRTRLFFEYSTDLFDATTIERLQGHLREVLRALAAAPETGLHEVELWSPAERHQVLAEWNDTGTAAVWEPRGLHGLFEIQVREQPHAPAVFFDGGSWSYAELDARAEGLARRLRRRGVGPETIVGLLPAGGPELALGMLGVLKAGGAFLPLDPAWPAARREALLADAGAFLMLDREGMWSEPGPALSPAPVSPEQTAYVIYTSGSTGRPKGVMVGHGAAVSFAREMTARCGLGAGDRFLQFAAPGFDVLIEEVFPAWARGGAVAFAPREELLTTAGLERALERHAVTSLELPTPYWNEWADDLERRGAAPPRALRLLLLGSEKPSPARLARWERHGVPVIHVFGLTETAVTSTLHPWTGQEPLDRELPIGRPVGNTQLYVLDREGVPVPCGALGELFIGGLGVARGYLSRPELTAERFVPDPFAAEPGERLYRTGDRARYRTDGELDFLGRLDEQVKVRGVRIEPGEVAAVLLAHPEVRDAVVVARENRLLAYVVLHRTDPTDPTDRSDQKSVLAAWLRDRLPEPMVPSAFVILEALPRTAHGKIDRAALPVPETSAGGGEAPRTPVEELLAGIWSEVLGRAAVGRDEDFFALGGHSLLATRVVSRIRTVLGAELPLRALFEAPTVAGLARAVEAGRGAAPPPIVPVPRDRDLPLSFAQHRLWLIDQLEPGSPAYNLPAGLRLRGPLEPGLLERLFAEVVRRHEVLRTTFVPRGGGAVQIVAPPATPALPLIDLTDLTDRSDRSDLLAREIARAEAQRPFDLERGPLLRLLLVRLSTEDHLLLLTMHHIVSDEWSTGLLIREVTSLHAAFSRGEASPLPELPVQYADFAVWQREWLQGEVLEAQLAVWRRRLAGAPQVLDLPTDRPRPAVPAFRGAQRPVTLPAGLAAAVRELSRREGATPFMTLLAAWAAVLGRHSGQDDLLVGAPVAGRNRQETEGLIGFFVNTLVLRADLSGAPSFSEALRRVREAALEAFTHQDLPFERLVEEIATRRDLARSPLIQVLFTLETGAPRLDLPDLALAAMDVESPVARFELTLSLVEGAEGLAGTLEHRTDLFDAATAERMIHRFHTLLAAAVEAPGTAVPELPLLPEAEARQLLEWGNARAQHAPGETLATLFEARARQTPGARAVTCAGSDLTYGELNDCADRLARRLRRLGVGPEARVGLCVERSLELIVGMLAIVKAGGAYVPLDPSYPRERLDLLIKDSGARVVVTREDLKDDKICNDTEGASLESLESLPSLDAGPHNTAYVIYTSGSTGRPKGVLVTHANVVRLLQATEDWFHFSPGDVWTLFHSSAFDFSVWEIWGALLSGGRLVVVPWEVSRTPEAFHELLAAERVTVLNQTPTAFAELMRVDTGAPVGALADLRLVIFGGEALLPARLAPWFERHGDDRPRLVNMYGITETTVHVTWRPVSSRDTRSAIGIPIPDLAVHVLDPTGLLAPLGVPGEIAVGGAGLARGYLGRPDLTAERFVPDPFSPEPGARLYRSGDLGRFLPAGELESLGRIDHQVKIRGFRIEPGEIEAALLAHPGVQQAAVLARGESLAAFVVPHPEREPALSELRSFLLATLPEHQVPSSFVRLDALPRTANGKVDRKALLDLEAAPAEDAFVAPRTPAEEILAGIFAEVLKVEAVGAEAHFFALGGHSLLATQVVSRVRSALGVDLPLRALFEAPTVAGLARAVEENRGAAPPPPIVRVPRDRDLPLSFAQHRLWLIDQLDPGSATYNVPAGIRLRGAVAPALLARIFAEVVCRHEVLRTTFAPRDGRPVQIVAPPERARPELPLIDLSSLPAAEREAEARALGREEVGRPFDLQCGPLLRLLLVRLEVWDHLLLMTMHHIVSDGWSIDVLVREVAALHAAFSRGEASPLPELPVQYADFAVWQREWLQGEVLEAQLAVWRRRLASAPQVLDLPTDRPRPAVQTFRGAEHPVALPAGLAAAVRELSRRESATPFMILLTAWAAVLGRHAGQDDLLLGAPVAGRNRREIEGLIGFFVNTLVLRADLSGAPSFAEALRRVRAAALEAFTHQDLPFERLVEDVAERRDAARSPLIQVLFALQSGFEERLDLSELTISPLEDEVHSARFELTLNLQEGAAGITGGLEHNTDLFDTATVERLARHFEILLTAALAEPGTGVAELPLLSVAEEQSLLEWGGARETGEVAAGATLGTLFAARARQAPGARAVTCEGKSLTYGELSDRAGRLARRLRELGVGPEVRVGLCAGRSLELIIGMVAIVQAGGAYVPLDPSYPQERLAFLIEDAGVRVVVTREDFQDNKDIKDCNDTEAVSLGGSPHNTAYVIYTSGSTGKPKGVLVTHANVLRLLQATDPWFGFGPDDVWTLFHSSAFDFSVWEIWGALLFGGRLVVVPWEVTRTPEAFHDLLAAERVTVLNQTPSAFAELMRVDEDPARAGALADLRLVIFGGEALLPSRLAPWLARHGGDRPRLVNMYGITETTVHVTYRPISAADTQSVIGIPIPDLSVHVLDPAGLLAPIGVPGEIAVGGAGLARGYLGRPGLTAERFVPDPFAGTPGARLYRSGDLGRFLPAGELEYLGRIDHQVKIRGFRIEPGEIEAALLALPGVREAAVLPRVDPAGGSRLIAFVVPRPEQRIERAELRRLLLRTLPEHQVPAAFVLLDALPLTAHGKVDRRALLVLEEMPRAAEDDGFAPPRTPAEELLADIWRQVLGTERVGVRDHFFELGGDSLLALQVVGRSARAGLAVTPQLLFAFPVLADLAAAAAQEAGGAAPPPLQRFPRSRPLPLSFAQERLWFLDRLEPGRAAYNIPLALRVRGALAAPACAAALDAMVRRHEALRTTFVELDGAPVQVIAPPPVVPAPVPEADLSALPAGRREPEALRLASDLAGLPFDLARGPLLRAAVLRLEEAGHVLLLSLHHIVADGWSLAILIRETAERLAGTEAPPELALQYADYAVWQRQWLTGDEIDRELESWRGWLAGVPLRLELPADRPRRAGGGSETAGLHVQVLPAAVAARTGELARSLGVTPFMIYLAAFQVLLWRLTGQERLVVGTAVANRLQPEVEEIVGLFVNTLPLPADLCGDPPVPELLARVREVTLGAFAHQQLPFDRLVDALQPERSAEQTPVVQAMLVLQNATRPAFAVGGIDRVEVPGLSFEPLLVTGGAPKFDLSLELVEAPQGLEASWEHRRLFEAATVTRWARGWANLLAALVERPEAAALRASELELLSPAERHQLLLEWGGAASPYPRDASVHELFAARAAAHPDTIALVALASATSEPVTVTYGELAARAGRLAARLLSLGAAPETPVAVCFERSPELIAALLGVLEAGAAFAPLDPKQPPERMAAMLDDLWPAGSAGPRLVVTSARHAPLFEELVAGGGRLVLAEGEEAAGAGPSPPERGGNGDRLVYVMFTSGSTGRPKGVAVTHRGVVRLVHGADYARFGPDETWLQIAPATFDASTLEIWGALLHGARLVLMPPGTPTLAELAAILVRHRVTTLHLTAGLFHQMVEEDLQALAPVRQLLTGGEALSPTHVLRAARELPGARLVACYGPTESTTFSSCWQVRAEGIEGSVPIGRPIPNTRVLILDIAGRPAGIGVAGELVIAGDGLARGYLGRPDLTAERFRPQPPPSERGARVYHTGDLARFLPDGTLDFIGRVDRQVKIRGFRVEPAEVEAALRAIPGVAEAVVMAHRQGGELRLLAFVTPSAGGDGAELAPAALRGALRGRLPEAFVPAALWVVPALPLTPNGKIDREALLRLGPLAPRPDAPSDAEAAAATRDPLEEVVAGIWCGVLGVERVGSDESFFDLGGHSLRATQVISRLRQACGVELPLRMLFEAPTVAGLTARVRAALVSGAGAGGDLQAYAAIPRRAPGAELPLSFAQERLWFIDQMMPGTAFYNLPGALSLAGRLDVAALAAALAEVVRRHEGLRTIFRTQDGRPSQVVLPSVSRTLPLVDLTALPEPLRAATAERLQNEEALRGFDLAAGPLFRFSIIRLAVETAEAPARYLLLLTFHHIVFDGWSTGVLARELAALYAAALDRRPSPLPELPLQYADFACWQRSWLSGDNLERITNYWRQRLSGVVPLRLPLDRPRPPLQTFSGGIFTLDLSPELALAVRRLAREKAVTPYMVGLTAFNALLHRYSGHADFAVGTWVANRNRPELEGLIGFFVNNLALRLDLSGSPTFGGLLAQAREAALGAYAHQDLPFEKLIEDLKLPRDLSMPPVFQVVCVQQPTGGGLRLREVDLEPMSSAVNPANVDLMLDLLDPSTGPYTATLVYNRDLFDPASIIRFGHHFEHLLGVALGSLGSLEMGIDAAIHELPLLSPAEAWQVAGEWSRGLPRPAAERLPGVDFVHQRIEHQAALQPEGEAVVWPGDAAAPAERLSYGELNARANRLARGLRRRGVGPEARVALWLPRGADLVISALAVLKAGGCYVPLDATYSGERLAFMAADAGARVLVTRGGLEGFAPPPDAAVLRLDDPELAAELAAESAADLAPAEVGLDPAHLAYVIYTSGSTGRPKGTMIEHRSLLTAYYAYEQAYRLADVTGHLQMASFSFDVFTGDLVRSLGSGARLVLCPREVLLDPARLDGLMRGERVDGAEFVPAVVRALIDHLEREGGSLDFMRLVVVSSDAWYAGEVEPLARLCGPRTRLIDSYGVTEATIDTTFLPLAAGDGTPCLPVPPAAAVVPIGRPLAGNEVWVLGGGIDLLPARMPGELCIGGAGVARGYLDRPELTAEKLTPHPFSAVPGARLYRAGDLARWLPDGSVEFLGRIDSQIKVRGFRIEPGEIEAVLGTHPQVRQAVVLALADGPGDKSLVAYLVPQPDQAPPDEAELRSFLKQRLPDYMVPALFVPLAELPLTPNGKVDRRALPVPDWSRSAKRSVYQPPSTAAEEMLAAIWCEVLRVSQVGVFDNFFAIGGHSLLATQVVARVRAAVGVELPLRALFETPTLAELAQVVEEQLILQMDDLTDEEIAGLS